MSALLVAGLGVTRDGADVLDDVTFSVAAGEVVALLGANGAGKTTTVQAIAGLVGAGTGTVALAGHDITALAPFRRARRGLAVVTDRRALCPTMTVAENLRLARAGAENRAAVDAWLPEVEAKRHQKAGALSGGEQAIVALARALIARPTVIVVDELSAGLSPALAQRAIAALRAAAASWGTGVLVVEQATRLALAEANRAVVLSQGRVVLQGAASDLVQRRDVLERAYLGGL